MNDFVVSFGDEDLTALPYGFQQRGVAQVVSHPEHVTSGGAHQNDIGGP